MAHCDSLLCCVQLVGGSANVSILLPLLEKLCSEEETTVRDAVRTMDSDQRKVLAGVVEAALTSDCDSCSCACVSRLWTAW